MRRAKIHRKTKETDVTVAINLDGRGEYKISTSIPFLDHMLTLMAYHGRIDLDIKARGDTEVDYHHLMEDLGITLGAALEEALADKTGIARFGQAKVPMDESLSEVIIDISGRPYLVYRIGKRSGTVKDLPVSLFEDFFRGFTNNARINLHIIVHYGRDLHHILESIFKAFGRALKGATMIEGSSVPSTKGSL
ncbi:MAG TPA: imidazoleglycerol-phosphate dehydratase HisB [Nitrospirae bacterium]|nr:imidazoleglycerol-phosphate dehydratase HisB [Nitrospirota bacterium]